MRTALLVSLTVLMIVVAAATYVLLQPKHATPLSSSTPIKRPPATAITMPSTRSDTGIFHETDRVWVKVPDEKTGALAWQFTSSHNEPQPDNSVLCDNPEAQFFYSNGQVVTIQGTRGRIVMQGGGISSASRRGPAGAPSRGELYDVVVTMATLANPRHAILRCRTNNVVFDNETFRIATDAYEDRNGRTVAADQVPVQIRGDDYDFDGRGLVIRWNDLDRRLQILEIAHGQSLVVKDPSLLPTPSDATTEPSVPRPATRAARPANTAASSNRKNSGRQRTPATEAATVPATRKATSQPVYRAVFNGGVRVTQANKTVASAETMAVDFKGKDQDDAPPAARPAADRRAGSATRRATSVTRPAATQPTPPPLVIRWPGKLVVTPVENNPPILESGEMNLSLDSPQKQTLLDYGGYNVLCAACTYLANGKGAELRSSATVPQVIVKNGSGTTLYTPALTYDQAAGRAVMTGKSHAVVRMQAATTQPSAAATQPVGILHASWSDRCVINLAGKTQEEMTLQDALISGEVRVVHPKLKLESNQMRIGFAHTDGDGKSVQVDQVTADGNVKTVLPNERGGSSSVEADHLNVALAATPDGQWRASEVTATGNVSTRDAETRLRAGRLTATLAPSTRPDDEPRVRRIVAQENVDFAANDVSGRADVLTADADGDDYDVRLQGQPAAAVKTADATLSGSLITLAPKRQVLGVVGAGTLSGSRQAAPGEKATPFEMTWRRGLTFDGGSNLAHADDQIVFLSKADDGTQNRATGDQLTLKLADAPASKSTRVRTTRPSDDLAAGFGSMQSKAVELLTLAGNAQVTSQLNDALGQLIRRLHLEAPSVQVADGGDRLIVPCPGRMLFEDHHGPATAPATQPLGGLDGLTAFQWQRQLAFDQRTHRADMEGSVVIVHQGGGADSFRIEADRVTAQLEDAPVTTRPVDPGSMSKVRRLTASRSVHVGTKQLQFDADQIDFDPTTGLMTARGDGRNPVTLYDDKGVTSGQFQELLYDTKTGQILRMLGVQGTFHR